MIKKGIDILLVPCHRRLWKIHGWRRGWTSLRGEWWIYHSL